ncbi:MAG TPA: protein phosphatase CheZ [Burkholderiales bacterium]|nr:protein phosphatase CheZ [Burkholderiales bacterium]
MAQQQHLAMDGVNLTAGDRADGGDAATPAGSRAPLAPQEVIQHLGRLTRALHEALSGLGYDKKIEQATQQLPDARERLAHIANLTWLAAERVLGAVEESQSLQQELHQEATSLLERWQAGMHFGDAAASDLAEDTCAFLDRSIMVSTTQSELLQDIMMAQDFHDLTGQVIKKVGALAQDLEKNLLQLLLETAPESLPARSDVAAPAAPKPADKVHSQAEVDALLDSMGF